MNKRDYQVVLGAFASKIKSRRSFLGMSQEELALKADIDRTFISKIERGIANPSLKTIHDIALVLDISLSDLFHG